MKSSDGAPHLLTVVAVEADFGDIEGCRCTLTAVEVWSQAIVVQLFWMPQSPLVRTMHGPIQSNVAEDALGRRVSRWNREWPQRWAIVDDAGTDYPPFAGSGVENDVLEYLVVRRAPAEDADVVTISCEADHGPTRASLSLREAAVRTSPGGQSPARLTSPPTHQYEGTIAVGTPLGMAGPAQVWLMAVDLLGASVNVRFAWTSSQDLSPDNVRGVARGIKWSLSDDVGTTYEQGAARGWSETDVGGQSRLWFQPSPPGEATVLTVTGDGEGTRMQHQIPLDRH